MRRCGRSIRSSDSISTWATRRRTAAARTMRRPRCNWPCRASRWPPCAIASGRKDADGRKTLTQCPLGEGMVDWPQFFGALAKANFIGPITLQVEYAPKGRTGRGAQGSRFSQEATRGGLRRLNGWHTYSADRLQSSPKRCLPIAASRPFSSAPACESARCGFR